MTNSRQPALLDLIAVTNNDRTPEVSVGDVGTIVGLLAPDAAEVEFLDEVGKNPLRSQPAGAGLARFESEADAGGVKPVKRSSAERSPACRK
jgi:hypothetical protein